ncbi:hypothetical protein CLU79DRAFT_833152 [Phycomyces nitens]|nr:hypothetical protein CLU79DRAFT_833152 [Phycomyces nitens]
MKIAILDTKYTIPRYLRLGIPDQREKLLFLWAAISKFNKYIKVAKVNRMTWNMWHRQSLTQIKPIPQRPVKPTAQLPSRDNHTLCAPFESQLDSARSSLSGGTNGLRRCKTHYANLCQYFSYNNKLL